MKGPSPDDLCRRALDLYRTHRHKEALQICLSLAESAAAPPSILSMIGTIYYRGRGVALDPEEGLRWYVRAAEAGDPAALTFLSGLQQDAGKYTEAKAMLEQAASQGHTRALVQLGYLYDRGLGVPRDPDRARKYFEQAAAEGYVFAKRFLAAQLLRGDDGVIGVAKGLVLFLRALFDGMRILIKDRYSEKATR